MPLATAVTQTKLRKTVTRTEAPRSRKTVKWILAAAAAVICIAAFSLFKFWPFDQKSVTQELQEASDSQLQIRAFRSTYFPHPGCIIEGLVFVHDSNAARPLITVDKLTIQGSYLSILARHVSLIVAEGLHVFIPPSGSGKPFHTKRSTITIGEIVANGGTLEFALHDPQKQPLRFDIHEASLTDVGWKGSLTYRLRMHNPEPPGEISATGEFGVWDQNDPARTTVSGEYKFERADLSIYHAIAGILSSTGKFGGTLGHIAVSGTTDTPNFEVTSGGHPVQLTTKFDAYVNAIHGDTFLKRVDAHFKQTQVVATGSIAGSPGSKGKTAIIDLSINNGRIEDIMGLFVKARRAPMSGAVTLQANAELLPGKQPFLKKLTMQGTFGVGGGEFSKPSTQEGIDKLSAGARGEKDPPNPET